MTQAQTILVVGGGIVGVFAALRARQLRPSSRILLIEQEDALGGLLRSDQHPNGLSFDRGTHVLSQTGVPAIDSLLFDDLNEADWHHFGGPHRDLAGLLMEGELREGSPFLPAPTRLVMERLSEKADAAEPPQTIHCSLFDTLLGLHGGALVDAVFRAPIRNLYRSELEELDPFVAGQLPLSRVVAGGLGDWLARMGAADFRQLVACPDQRKLPAHLASPLKAIYPRRMGIGQLFEHLRPLMGLVGIEICLSTRIAGLSLSGRQIDALGLQSVSSVETFTGPLHLIWAVPPFQLLSMLGLPKPAASFVPGWRTVIVDFCARLTRPLGCYYYIDYGDNDWFRLTNYSALCDEAADREASPFTFELWSRSGDLDDAAAHTLIVQRFLQLGLIKVATDVSDVRLRRTAQGVLFATTGNMAALRMLADTVNVAAPNNFTSIGMLSQPGLFFTGDMLRNAEIRLSERLS